MSPFSTISPLFISHVAHYTLSSQRQTDEKMEANIVSIHSEDLLKTFMVEMQGPFCPTTARQSVVNSRAKLHDISEISSLFHGNHQRPPKLFTQLLRMIDALIPPTSLAKR